MMCFVMIISAALMNTGSVPYGIRRRRTAIGEKGPVLGIRCHEERNWAGRKCDRGRSGISDSRRDPVGEKTGYRNEDSSVCF